MSERDLRALAKRAIAKASSSAGSVHSAADEPQGKEDQSAESSEASSLAETLAKQTAAMKPSDLHEKQTLKEAHEKKLSQGLTPDEKKVLKHEAAAEKKAEARETRRESKMSLSMKKQSPSGSVLPPQAPVEDIKLDAADEEINAWLRQQPQQWLKEQLRLAVDEHSTGAAAAAALAAANPAASEALVCVSLVATATDEWCSSFCAEHSCPESMCKCEGGGRAQA
jgi:hypothetical protein